MEDSVQLLNTVADYAPNYFTDVRNPKWADAGHTKIFCEVNFKHVPFEEWTPFCADPNDYMPYSKILFEACSAGKFGTCEPWVDPIANETSLTPEQLASIAARAEAARQQASNQINGIIL